MHTVSYVSNLSARNMAAFELLSWWHVTFIYMFFFFFLCGVISIDILTEN